jgi:hypothetical protein
MSVAEIDLAQVRQTAEAELVEARTLRERLSLDALAGVPGTPEQLVEIEAEIARLERRIALASLAVAERSRRERVEQEQQERERREEARREAQSAAASRQQRLTAVRVQLARLGDAISAFLGAENQLQDCSVRAQIPYQALAKSVALLSVITLRDAGLHGDDLSEWVPAAERKRLLDRFPPEPVITTDNGVSSARCSVCECEQRGEIERALREGESLRTIEERFGFSRSTLSRHHRQHASE